MIGMPLHLSPRERALVGVLLPIVVVAATYQFIWLPVQANRFSRQAEIAAYLEVTDKILAMASTTSPALPVDTGPVTPLSTRVTQSAENAGLELRRLEPEGDMLRVTMDDVAFANVILWLSDLEVSQSVIVSAIEIDRRVAPGIVSARLLMKANP